MITRPIDQSNQFGKYIHVFLKMYCHGLSVLK